MNCTGCTFEKFPVCAIQSIITTTTIENIIAEKSTNNTEYPVCHKNAQSINENRIIKKDSCNSCSLCDLLCINKQIDNSLTDNLEKAIFFNLNRLNMYIKKMLPHCIVGSEIKAKGHAREKRIDIVIKKGDVVYLVKALTNTDKIPYYSRSYNDLINYYTDYYSENTFKKAMVIPQKHIEDAMAMDNECYTLETLIKEITEV